MKATRHFFKNSALVLLFLSFATIIPRHALSETFTHTIKNPADGSAQTYIESKSNIRLNTEGSTTYWLPAYGAETEQQTDPGVLVFHFPFQEPIAQGTLFVKATTFHWNYSQGHTITYLSTDGENWQKVAEGLPPEYGGWSSGNFSGDLPSYFVGAHDIYVKVELYSYGPSAHKGGALTNTAQALRYDSNRDDVTFRLEVETRAAEETAGGSGSNGQPARQLVATISNGTDLNLDWAGMPEASSYTLYYGFGNVMGELILSTIGSIDMGAGRSLNVPGLPSGMVFYAAVLAHTPQGDVLSNLEKFAGFSGSVEVPQAGDVLLRIQDRDGFGNWEARGNRLPDGSFELQEIAVSKGGQDLLMQIQDDRLERISMGGNTLDIVYGDDGKPSGMVALARAASASASTTSAANPLCSKYSNRDEYLAAINKDNSEEQREMIRELTQQARGLGLSEFLINDYIYTNVRDNMYLESDYTPSEYMATALADALFGDKDLETLTSWEKERLTKIFYMMMSFYNLLMNTVDGVRMEVTENMLARYDEACNNSNQQGSTGSSGSQGGGTVTGVTNACTVPEGATCKELWKDGALSETICLLDGRRVGPDRTYWIEDDGSSWLFVEKCRNEQGQKDGWEIHYTKDGLLVLAIPYVNGIKNGHMYDYYTDAFDQDGNQRVYVDNLFVNDVNTTRWIYYEDGSLKGYCDCAGDGVIHYTN